MKDTDVTILFFSQFEILTWKIMIGYEKGFMKLNDF